MNTWIGWFGLFAIGFSQQSPINVTLAAKTVTKADILARVYGDRERLKLCDGDIDRTVAEESAVYPLAGDRYLVQFLCFMGAYQGNYEYYLYKATDSTFSISPLSLEIIEDTGSDRKTPVRSIGGLPEYDREQQLLTVHTKYRGLGDCGTFARYRWRDTRFQLIEYRIKENCDGKYIDPDRYSRVYPGTAGR
ncbi:DUF1176 domain-containing protein [Pannus brasiliensis CCIBt3594]|uniref:DUF1176 domain-containing protein n=1 Tax=Pannus brasiliensis CCIBt3594 TaxID=1427578 RepID=A0AAW9QM59_9CHRO